MQFKIQLKRVIFIYFRNVREYGGVNMNKFRYYLIANYLMVQVFALTIGYKLWGKGVDVPGIIEERIVREVGNAGRNILPLVLLGLVLVISLALLILIKYGLSYFFYFFTEYGLLFLLISFILYSLYPNPYLSVLVPGIAVVFRYTLNQFKHVSVVILAVGAAAILGSLNIYYVIAFLLLLALYDILAVRKTKHMTTIAEDAYERGSSLIFTFNTEEETFILGSADIILPSILVVSVFLHYFKVGTLPATEAFRFSIVGAFLTSVFALAGLLIAMRHREAPALPYASVGILGFLIVESIRFLLA